MNEPIRKLVRDERAATAVEYGLILTLVVLGMMVGLRNLGGAVHNTWTSVDNAVASSH